MKTCLVTGSSGLIGSFFIREAIKNYELFTVSKDYHTPLPAGVHPIRADLNDPTFASQLPNGIDAIVHLAQSNYHKDFPSKALDIFSVNTESTLRLLDFARETGVKKFIYASSGIVYGNSPFPFTEDMYLKIDNSLGFYYLSKLTGELLVESYAKEFDVLIFRFFFVYGKNQNKKMLIPRLIESVFQEKPILLQGNEGIKINPIHVSDAAKAIEASLESTQTGKINIGGKEILSLRTIAETIGRKVGKTPEFKIDLSREPKHLIGDITKMSTLFGEPIFSFEEGIKDCMERNPICVA